MSSVRLKGMTWSHPRGYDPMVACSRIWKDKTGVEIDWDKRSLQDFESFPVEELARAYDLIVIDHPHVGEVTAQDCLVPLDGHGSKEERTALARGNVGGSYGQLQLERSSMGVSYRCCRTGPGVATGSDRTCAGALR